MNDVRLQDHRSDTKLVQSRLIIAALIVLLLAGVLLWRLFDLQVTENQRFNTLSRENRIRFLPIPPVRGQIYDRNGIPLAENLPVYAIQVHPDQVRNMNATLNRISELVPLSQDDIDRFRESLKTRPGFEARLLKSGLTDEEAARVAANQHLIDGVELTARLQRYYPFKGEMVDVVGYVGRISESDLKRIDVSAYRGTDYIGKLGVEEYYEKELLGKVGYREVETNAHGKVVRVLSTKKAVAGDDLYLSIDANLQKATRQYLGDYDGAVVAVQPKTGAILAFVSNPIYNPNPFVEGISKRAYQMLREDPNKPLLNRALNGRYAPGSTIKPIFALAGLEYGRDPNKTTFCPGYYTLPGGRHHYRCWKRWGHGKMDLHDAIAQSCDVYFYQLAHTLGIAKLDKFMYLFGLGRTTGIDLDGEPTGLAPSPAWKKKARGQIWFPGETVITGIGQGYTLVTPLQMAMAVATIAEHGKRMQPHILDYSKDASTGRTRYVKPKILSQVKLDNPDYFNEVIEAMKDVVNGPHGTARHIGVGAKYLIAGKTGTAQVVGMEPGHRESEDSLPERFRDHALFIAFAPVDDPKIAVAVIAEHGGGGSHTAAPIARKVMDYYLLGPPSEESGKPNAA